MYSFLSILLNNIDNLMRSIHEINILTSLIIRTQKSKEFNIFIRVR